MGYQPRVVLVLQQSEFATQLANLLEIAHSFDVDLYRQLSRGAFINDRIDLVVLEVRENNFSIISSMITMLESLQNTPPIMLLTDDKSVKRAQEFSEVGVIAVMPSGFPVELVAMQIDSLLSLEREIETLRDQLKNARNVALQSMSASSQLGEVVRFQEKSYSVKDFNQLADMLIGSVNLLGASCSGVFRVAGDNHYFGEQAKRDITLHRLEEHKGKSRFVDVEEGVIVYFPDVWVYLTDMPVFGSNEYGQLKDSVFPLIESAGQRAHTIVAEHAATLAERNKSWFLKNVSHSFREPINAVLSGTTLLRRGLAEDVLNGRNGDVLHLVETSANQLADLIEDLLALSDAENIQVSRKEFCLQEELRDTLDLYQRWAESKGVDLITNLVDNEMAVYTDPKHFKQVLRSLLSNALKYTHEGSIELSMEKVGSGESEVLEISVTDTGKGFSVDEIQPYLRPFVELDKETIQKGDGAGLGLSVIVQLLNQLDGNISIDSEPGKGSCFTVAFPVYKPEGAEHHLFS